MIVWCSHLVPACRPRAGSWPAIDRGNSWSALDLRASRRIRGCCSCPILPTRGKARMTSRSMVMPPSESAQLRAVLEALTRHTRASDDCYFCLWDGWGSDIEGGDGARILDWRGGTVRRGPRIAPAFPRSVLDGPKVVVPNRAYYVLLGKLTALGDWGAAESGQGNPSCTCPRPRSSGRPTIRGASPTTSTHTGPGSEPTSRSSTSFWLIHNSTLFRLTHARTSLPTGRHRKGPSVPLVTAVQAVPAIADDCSDRHSRTFRRQLLKRPLPRRATLGCAEERMFTLPGKCGAEALGSS
jgi:hypothetical protein